uniref:peptidylprolyl isomerase n=1 Tax=Panagrellus redivivus TaxID=6233 RepID=A0A7E4VSD3_PANRE
MGLVLGIPEYLCHPSDENGDPIPYHRMNPRVYLDFATAAGDDLGRITIRLSADTHPLLSENFRQLCTGERKVRTQRLHYKFSPIHTVQPKEGIISGGDIVHHNGHGGQSAVVGMNFVDCQETLKPRRGSVCMLNQSHKSNRFDSHFFILTKDPEKLEDGVCFGHVEDGMDVLDYITWYYGTNTGNPAVPLVIKDCDQL